MLPAALYSADPRGRGRDDHAHAAGQALHPEPGAGIVSLFFWHAIWGIPGAFLAVPLLATFKILCDRVEPLQPLGHIIGS